LDVQFGRGDIYVICRLEALSDKIIVDEEVEEASVIILFYKSFRLLHNIRTNTYVLYVLYVLYVFLKKHLCPYILLSQVDPFGRL
jgi:hypothetical protein